MNCSKCGAELFPHEPAYALDTAGGPALPACEDCYRAVHPRGNPGDGSAPLSDVVRQAENGEPRL